MIVGTEKILLETLNLMPIEPSVLFVGEGINLDDPNITSRPWCSIFTSQDSENAFELFDNDSRRIFEITALEDIEQIKLSRIDLPVVRLCGIKSIGNDVILQDQFQLAALEKLPKLLCDYGNIIFAGHFDADIIKNFCLKIMGLNRKKVVLFFDLSEGQRSNNYIKRLIEEEKAILFDDSFSRALNKVNERLEEYDFNDYSKTTKNDLIIYISGKPVSMSGSLDKEVLLNVNRFAQLLNINDVERTNIFPPSEKIQRFASFLQSSTTGFPQWYGYRENNSFHIFRYFENDLYERTEKILANAATKERKGNPIMLRGQACCGKTNALCALAYRIFSEKKYPVIFIPESSINFNVNIEKDIYGNVVKRKTSDYEALEMLLRKIEEKTENPVPALIVWDTACRTRSELRKASDLLFSLREDGRQVQIVCTGYSSQETHEEDKPRYSFIDVDVFLHNDNSYNEVELVRNFLIEKGGFLPVDAYKYMHQYAASDNFFASLYMFRELHIDLKKRLRRENEGRIDDISAKIDDLSKSAATENLNSVIVNQLKNVIEKSGWQISSDLDIEEDEAKSEEIKQRLINIVCSIAFCTIYKEKLPVSIIFRMLGNINVSTSKIFDVIMNNSLLIHSLSPENEVPAVVVRSELEAKLILEEYKKDRIDIVLSLLDNFTPNNSEEARLIQSIIRLIGPNNKNSALSLWKWNNGNEEFDTILAKLREIRKKTSCEDLVLQEITLGREIVQACNWLDESERKQRMAEIIDLANKTIEEFDGLELNSFLANVYVEWANLCSRYSTLDSNFSKKAMFEDVGRKINVVINHFPKNGYAYSAYLWAGLTYIKSLDESDESKFELLEKLASIRDIVETELMDAEYDENVLAGIDNLLDNFTLSEERFERSIENGKAYGLYFKVRQIQGFEEMKLDYNSPMGDKAIMRKKCKEIVDLLTDERYYPITITNPACLYALINTQWLLLTEDPIIPTIENVLVGLPKTKWSEIYSLCKKYLYEVSNIRTARIVYLLALCAANLDEHRHECQELFDEIRNAEWFERRTLHIICDKNKNPIKFSGRLSGRYSLDKNRGYIYIDAVGLSSPVFFRADRIGLRASDLRENMKLRDLSLATSFSGFQACKV